MADLALGRLRAKIPDLVQALSGRVTLHHRRTIQRSLKHLEFLEESIIELEKDMEQYFAPSGQAQASVNRGSHDSPTAQQRLHRDEARFRHSIAFCVKRRLSCYSGILLPKN
ncbi:MAG: hypothetical protein ACYCVB_05035 [Bacilli bacterium]